MCFRYLTLDINYAAQEVPRSPLLPGRLASKMHPVLIKCVAGSVSDSAWTKEITNLLFSNKVCHYLSKLPAGGQADWKMSSELQKIRKPFPVACLTFLTLSLRSQKSPATTFQEILEPDSCPVETPHIQETLSTSVWKNHAPR